MTSVAPSLDRGHALLDWFSGLGMPMHEERLQMGALSYFHFSTVFPGADGRPCTTHGQSLDRKTAAIKCVAEYVERKTMIEYFQKEEGRRLIPDGLRTSNGWAVHLDRDQAEARAYREALERHLLIKSFLKSGWGGLRLVEKVDGNELTLHFLVSSFSSQRIAAGLVIAQSPEHRGVSFGYCTGEIKAVPDSSFWESAIFESVGKVKALAGKHVDLSIDPESWILSELKAYLEEPFDFSLLTAKYDGQWIEEEIGGFVRHSFELSEKIGTPFPVFASFVHGGGLIPLFHKARLTSGGLSYLTEILAANGLAPEIPERLPVL